MDRIGLEGTAERRRPFACHHSGERRCASSRWSRPWCSLAWPFPDAAMIAPDTTAIGLATGTITTMIMTAPGDIADRADPI